ncbi:hypothetical protein SAMN05443144_10234 [Fodinibius roseus]|uniref:Uncharacterized protein n=1 Tax=Fodinibius roseus TaxID=1194090 RepID=A0A1M4UGZ4_9BACT|nr:hypothetical protein SAMN05443144_10234 [Fodinibius roseus]
MSMCEGLNIPITNKLEKDRFAKATEEVSRLTFFFIKAL